MPKAIFYLLKGDYIRGASGFEMGGPASGRPEPPQGWVFLPQISPRILRI